MKGKILCPAGCQNPVARITKAKEILKNPRPAGSWRPLKCIFSGKGKSRSQRAAKPRSGVILAKGKKAAHSGPQALSCPFYVRKNQTGAVCGSLRARQWARPPAGRGRAAQGRGQWRRAVAARRRGWRCADAPFP